MLPAHWSHGNPVDILGDADPERYAKALKIAAQDPNSDGLLVILIPPAMTNPTLTRRGVEALRHDYRQTDPHQVGWGGAEVASGAMILNRASIPTFPYPHQAAQVFDYMWHYSSNLRRLYETPLPSVNSTKPGLTRHLGGKAD